MNPVGFIATNTTQRFVNAKTVAVPPGTVTLFSRISPGEGQAHCRFLHGFAANDIGVWGKHGSPTPLVALAEGGVSIGERSTASRDRLHGSQVSKARPGAPFDFTLQSRCHSSPISGRESGGDDMGRVGFPLEVHPSICAGKTSLVSLTPLGCLGRSDRNSSPGKRFRP
jgi:hypothetical protein